MLNLRVEQETVMAGCYELTDQRWLMIKDIVSPPQTIVHFMITGEVPAMMVSDQRCR